jgi:hypothetical protein
MTVIELQDDIRALVARLKPHNTWTPPDSYWIEDSDGADATGGYDFCYECGLDYMARLNLYTPGADTYDLMWNDPCRDCDAIPHCNCCGKTLAGWPTDYCRSEELDYYEETPDFSPSRENIHVICMVLWNLQWSEDPEDSAAWLAVGRALAAKLQIDASEPPRASEDGQRC